jgi:hypothetical protein
MRSRRENETRDEEAQAVEVAVADLQKREEYGLPVPLHLLPNS